MITHLYFTTDPSDGGIKEALSQSAVPADAVVQADPATGLVSITTTGPWRADKRGYEEGLGVPGWAYVETQHQVDEKEAAKYTIREKEPIDIKAVAVETLSGGKKAVRGTDATPPVGLALAGLLMVAALWVFWPPTIVTYGGVNLPPELENEWPTVVEAWEGYHLVTEGAAGEIDVVIDPGALDLISTPERTVDGYSQIIDGTCVIHLRNEDPLTFAHEVGHCIGLDHSWRTGTIMHRSERGWNH